MRVLVTGGAGYIGSHTAAALRRAGHETLILDDLRTGHAQAAKAAGCELVVGDVGDQTLVEDLLRARRTDVVVHFAADSLVGQSMVRPGDYWANNVGNGLRLLEAMKAAGVGKIVFSSTAAVYGAPERVPIAESHPRNPANTYGMTKLAFEHMLESFERACGLRYLALRYFNAAGADRDGELGEDHQPESHLVPLILQVALGQRPHVAVFGSDYPTPDGTCIRDYIHVADLASAHVLAVEALARGCASNAYNLGTGRGFTVRQVIQAARRVTGCSIPVHQASRREGDPAVLVASSEHIRRELGWSPRYPDLEAIIGTAWRWHRSHPFGFRERG